MSHYRIDCGDGTTYEVPRTPAGDCPAVPHTYAAAGTYTVTVTAMFGDGTPVPYIGATVSTTVTVTAPAPPPAPRKAPAAIDYGGYASAYNFPNYATSG